MHEQGGGHTKHKNGQGRGLNKTDKQVGGMKQMNRWGVNTAYKQATEFFIYVYHVHTGVQI